MYAKLEEEHGLARHAMAIYNRATRAVDSDEKYDVYNIYIAKAAEMYGITYTRPIYEDAIENLPEGRSRDMCIRFAELERKLGEIDRARAVYRHCSQMCDPRVGRFREKGICVSLKFIYRVSVARQLLGHLEGLRSGARQ
jgi:pre-mRNA-splicing factor SYF1